MRSCWHSRRTLLGDGGIGAPIRTPALGSESVWPRTHDLALEEGAHWGGGVRHVSCITTWGSRPQITQTMGPQKSKKSAAARSLCTDRRTTGELHYGQGENVRQNEGQNIHKNLLAECQQDPERGASIN